MHSKKIDQIYNCYILYWTMPHSYFAMKLIQEVVIIQLFFFFLLLKSESNETESYFDQLTFK